MPKNPMDPNDIPEVAAYVESKEMLEAFRKNHAQVFSSYEQLVADLNQKMEAADKVVRAQGISCADWDLYQTQTKIDAEALFNALGMDLFLQVGGKTGSKTTYSVDKATVQAAAARGDIPKAVVDGVVKESPRYHAPTPLS
jgi:hypothetical protein